MKLPKQTRSSNDQEQHRHSDSPKQRSAEIRPSGECGCSRNRHCLGPCVLGSCLGTCVPNI